MAKREVVNIVDAVGELALTPPYTPAMHWLKSRSALLLSGEESVASPCTQDDGLHGERQQQTIQDGGAHGAHATNASTSIRRGEADWPQMKMDLEREGALHQWSDEVKLMKLMRAVSEEDMEQLLPLLQVGHMNYWSVVGWMDGVNRSRGKPRHRLSTAHRSELDASKIATANGVIQADASFNKDANVSENASSSEEAKMEHNNASRDANSSTSISTAISMGSIAAGETDPVQRGKLKAGRYDGTTSWEAFQAKFELVAAANGWSVAEKAVRLATSLEGEAQRVLLDLTVGEMKDPQAVATAVTRRFGKIVPAVAIRQQFSKRTRKPGEALGVFAAEIRYLARKGFTQFPEDVRLALATEAFITGLTPEALRQHVRLARPETLEEALERALAIEEVFSESHTAPISRAHPQVYQAQLSSPPPQPTTTAARPRRSGPPRFQPDGAQGQICWRCGQSGHRRRDCTRLDSMLEAEVSGNESGPVL